MSAPGRAQVHAAVLSALAESARRAGLDPAELRDDADILGSGLVDSLGFVDLLMSVEAELGRPLALERLDFDRIDSLAALVDQLHELQEGAGAPAPPATGTLASS